MQLSPAARAAQVFVYLVLLISAAVALTPIIWLLAATTKNQGEMFSYTFFGPHPTLDNYKHLMELKPVPFYQYFINSTFVACAGVLVQLFFSSLGGFALAKYNFKGKKTVMIIMLATMMIPGQVLLAPVYELVYKMGLVDNYAGLIIPGAVSVFGMFLFRQSIMQVPDEIIQAAADGCSEFRIYWDIVMPVSRPMIGAFCLVTFMGTWNGFLWPQIILHADEHSTLPVALNQMINLYQQDYGLLMAGTLVSILPLFVLFLMLQKEFVAGLTAGAVKG